MSRLGPGDKAGFQFGQEPGQVLEVELVLEAGPPGLQENGEVRVAPDRVQEFLGLEAAHPQGQPLPEPGTAKQQGPPGRLPEPGPEKPGALQTPAQQLFHGGAFDQGEEPLSARLIRGQDQGRQSFAREYLRPGAVTLLPGRGQGQAQGPVDPAAPEGVDDDLGCPGPCPPGGGVLHQDVMAVRQGGVGGLLLVFQKTGQYLGRGLVPGRTLGPAGPQSPAPPAAPGPILGTGPSFPRNENPG